MVLIIGILAAIALPQYKKSVEKARFVEPREWTRRIYEAEKAFYLANGTWGHDMQALPVDFPPGTQYSMNESFGSAQLPNGGLKFSFNKNNNSIQYNYKNVLFTLYLEDGTLYCYFHVGDDRPAKKAFCLKLVPSGEKCTSSTACLVARFSK